MPIKQIIISLLLIISVLSCNAPTKKVEVVESENEAPNRFEIFAKQLEKSIIEGNYTLLNSSWDIELFKQKVSAMGEIDYHALEGGEKYYRKVIYKSNNDMVFDVKKGGDFVLSKFHFENGVPKAFYTYKTYYGLNFIEFVFSEKGKEIKIIDYYNFQMGEYYSQSVKKMIDFVSRYGMNKGAYVDAMQLVGLSIAQANNKRNQEAWKTINAIDKKILNDNYFQTKRLMVASTVSKEVFGKAIEDFIELYPKNEKLQLYYQNILYDLRNDLRNLKLAKEEMEKIVGKSDLFSKWKGDL